MKFKCPQCEFTFEAKPGSHSFCTNCYAELDIPVLSTLPGCPLPALPPANLLCKCRVCGGSISREALACPHCGDQLTAIAIPSFFYFVAILWMVIGGLVLIYFALIFLGPALR